MAFARAVRTVAMEQEDGIALRHTWGVSPRLLGELDPLVDLEGTERDCPGAPIG